MNQSSLRFSVFHFGLPPWRMGSVSKKKFESHWIWLSLSSHFIYSSNESSWTLHLWDLWVGRVCFIILQGSEQNAKSGPLVHQAVKKRKRKEKEKIKVPLKALKHETSSVLLWSFSLLVMVFLFAVLCHSKKRESKILNYWHKIYYSYLYWEMPVSNVNIRAFHSYAESLKWYNWYFIAHACICVLFLPGRWKHYTKPTQLFLFHILRCTHSTTTLFLLLMNRTGLERRGAVGGLIFPFPFPSMSSFSLVVVSWHR